MTARTSTTVKATSTASEPTTKEASDAVIVVEKASAAVTPSVSSHKAKDKSTTTASSTKTTNTTVDKMSNAPALNTSKDWNAQFQAIWKTTTTTSNNKEQMLQQTLHWMHRMVVDDLLPHATMTMHREQQLLLQVQHLQDSLDDSKAALAQSQAAERKSQAALEKLHHAVQAATTQARDHADKIQQDAQLSLQLTQLQQELQDAQIEKQNVQHQLKLTQDELSSTKTLLSKKTAQVLQLERNARLVATATSSNHDSNSDLNYYKTKVQELQTRHQGLTAALQEQTARCHDYQRQLMSMQGRHGGSSSNVPKLKKRRFS